MQSYVQKHGSECFIHTHTQKPYLLDLPSTVLSLLLLPLLYLHTSQSMFGNAKGSLFDQHHHHELSLWFVRSLLYYDYYTNNLSSIFFNCKLLDATNEWTNEWIGVKVLLSKKLQHNKLWYWSSISTVVVVVIIIIIMDSFYILFIFILLFMWFSISLMVRSRLLLKFFFNFYVKFLSNIIVTNTGDFECTSYI